jgi:hypothetical protein
MQAKGVTQVKKLEHSRSYSEGNVDERINFLQAELEDVMRLRRTENAAGSLNQVKVKKEKCEKCTYEHSKDKRCPAEGRQCNKCDESGHFASSTLCKATGWARSEKKMHTAKRVEEES